MRISWSARGIVALFGLVSVFFVSACSEATITVSQGSSATATSTATAGASAPSSGSAATCATYLAGASAASASTTFADVPYPTGTVTGVTTPVAGGTGRWTVKTVTACAPNTSAASVNTFYASQMTAQGWGTAANNKAPFDGGYQVPCHNSGNGLCWQKDAAPRYVALESVADKGNNVVTFTLCYFAPPPPPSCTNPGFSESPIHGYQSFAQVFTLYVPLPPLSLLLPNDASGGQKGLEICSAGTVASIASFLSTELPHEGWTLSQNISSTNQVWKSGSNTFTFQVMSATDWFISWRIPFPAS